MQFILIKDENKNNMNSVVKHCGVILILTVLGVVCYPPCYNWCPAAVGYGCCDHQVGGYYPGQGYYPDYPRYQQITQPLYCPAINCSNPPTIVRNCTDDNDCLRKETCCINPCDEGKKACIVGVHQPVQMRNCPAVNNCNIWLAENINTVICNTDDDCKRSETCCSIPCINNKVCQKSRVSNLPVNCQFGAPCNGIINGK